MPSLNATPLCAISAASFSECAFQSTGRRVSAELAVLLISMAELLAALAVLAELLVTLAELANDTDWSALVSVCCAECAFQSTGRRVSAELAVLLITLAELLAALAVLAVLLTTLVELTND